MNFLQKTLCFIFLLSTFCATTQESLIFKKGSKFYFENKVFNKSELGDVLTPSPVALGYYEKAMRSRKTARNTGIVGGAFAGVTVLFIVGVNNADQLGTGLVLALGGVITGATSLVLTFVSIGYSSDCSSNLKSAVNHYNWEIGNQPKKETSSVSLGLTQNGAGLVYTF